MVATNNTGHIFKVWIFLFKKFYYLTFLSVCGRMWWRDLENRQKSFTLNFPFEISGAKCVEQNGNLQSWCYFLKPILMPEEEGINTKYISSVCCVPPKSTAYVFPQKRTTSCWADLWPDKKPGFNFLAHSSLGLDELEFNSLATCTLTNTNSISTFTLTLFHFILTDSYTILVGSKCQMKWTFA
jgi:hypothetical protein